ncbi:hypothetical protein D9M68_480170 [compost metagenome]
MGVGAVEIQSVKVGRPRIEHRLDIVLAQVSRLRMPYVPVSGVRTALDRLAQALSQVIGQFRIPFGRFLLKPLVPPNVGRQRGQHLTKVSSREGSNAEVFCHVLVERFDPVMFANRIENPGMHRFAKNGISPFARHDERDVVILEHTCAGFLGERIGGCVGPIDIGAGIIQHRQTQEIVGVDEPVRNAAVPNQRLDELVVLAHREIAIPEAHGGAEGRGASACREARTEDSIGVNAAAQQDSARAGLDAVEHTGIQAGTKLLLEVFTAGDRAVEPESGFLARRRKFERPSRSVDAQYAVHRHLQHP